MAADLAAVGGGDDLAADNVVVNGTNGDDVAVVTGAGPNAEVTGLPALVSVSGAIAGSDRVTVNAWPEPTWSMPPGCPPTQRC